MSFIFVSLVGLGLLAMLLGIQSVGASELRRRVQAVAGLYPADGTLTVIGTTLTTTFTATTASEVQFIIPGMSVSGLGVAPLTTVVSVVLSTGVVTLSTTVTTPEASIPVTFSWVNSTAEIHLYQQPYTGGLDPAPGDFTEATFTGYTALPLDVATGPYTTSSGSGEISLGAYNWILTSVPATGNVIGGYWLDYIPPGGTARVVSFWEAFPTPIQMTTTGNYVNFALPLDLPEPGSAVMF